MLTPYKRTPAPPVIGLVTRERTVILEDGTVMPLDFAPGGVKLYADRELVRGTFLHRGDGEAICWNNLPIRWLADGANVLLLSGWPGDGPDVLEALTRWRDWAAGYGAAVGSVGQTSWSLMRATLQRPILTNGGSPPPLGEVIGGRQQAGILPGYYGDFTIYDLAAAYATTLGELVYPGPWREVGPVLSGDAAPWPCYVAASVRVPPDLAFGPLPRRARKPRPLATQRRMMDAEREYPVGKVVSGVWSLAEIRAAMAAGAHVKIRRVWIATGTRLDPPFAPWWAAIQAGRKMDGLAGALCKQTGNALWGRFCAYGERTRVHYVDGHPIRTPDPIRGGLPPAMDLAELVTGSVRARLYGELMAPDPGRVLSVHTDGGLLEPGPKPAGKGWRVKDHGTSLTFLSPQAYSYVTRASGGTVYKVAGIRGDLAPAAFHAIASAVLGQPRIDVDPEAVRALREGFPEVGDLLLTGRP